MYLIITVLTAYVMVLKDLFSPFWTQIDSKTANGYICLTYIYKYMFYVYMMLSHLSIQPVFQAVCL